ncbi:unnamed protein product [Pleuronectes platessa]|uniref:Uncharacterized protein n=1 Tax=Pleuronectes platessa TaxID=8262 RepID=A0A9N7W4B8_PLEPL|nr:unnamed protein product [Pleuronectes platessa]
MCASVCVRGKSPSSAAPLMCYHGEDPLTRRARELVCLQCDLLSCAVLLLLLLQLTGMVESWRSDVGTTQDSMMGTANGNSKNTKRQKTSSQPPAGRHQECEETYRSTPKANCSYKNPSSSN